MDDQKTTPGKFGVNFGLILGGIMILIAIIMYATDMAFKGQQWPVYIYYVVFPTMIIYTMRQYKKHNANTLLFTDALKTGIIVALISSLVYVGYIFIFNYIIDTGYNEKIIDFSIDQIAESDAPVEAKEMSLKMVKFFSDPLAGSAIWIALSLFFGLIYSMIGGLVMKTSSQD